MNPHQGTSPAQRSDLLRRSSIAAAGVVIAGIAGTAALAVGIQGSVHQPTTAGFSSDDDGGADYGPAGSGFGGGHSSSVNGQFPGLSAPAPAPANGSVSGGSHGS